MRAYSVEFYTGDYAERQRAANQDKARLYCEHHLNSAENPTADYACVVVAVNASETSKEWGRWYTREISRVFNVRDNGLLIGGYQGRGNENLVHTAMPAILLEPLFGSTPRHAEIIRSHDGQRKLAQVLVASILCMFPDGGLCGFSVGHKGKTSNPNDRGAAVHGTDLMEADYAEMILLEAARMIEQI